MRQYAVYQNPLDYPGQIVVRGWTVHLDGTGRLTPDPVELYIGNSLEEAREAILQVDPNLYRLERFQNDEPQIVEVWI